MPEVTPKKPSVSFTAEQQRLRDEHFALANEARELCHEAADALKRDLSPSTLLITIETAITTLMAARQAARKSLISVLHLSQDMTGEGEPIR
jgi:hypothetical protein